MWIRIRRKKLKPIKSDYIGVPFEYTKSERVAAKVRQPDLVKIKERYSIVFELVESYRSDDGKARQRTKYISSIAGEYVNDESKWPFVERKLFWRYTRSKLKRLNLSQADFDKLTARIAEVVTEPTAEQVDAQIKSY